jgi:hypothetical protein
MTILDKILFELKKKWDPQDYYSMVIHSFYHCVNSSVFKIESIRSLIFICNVPLPAYISITGNKFIPGDL